jgi:hypothetical protein
MVMLPARNYYYKIIKEQHSISIPRKGSYDDLLEEENKGIFNNVDGEFNIFDENNNILYLPSITKVLFATKQYPDLPQNHLFIPVFLIFLEEEVKVVGQIVEMLSKEAYEQATPLNDSL